MVVLPVLRAYNREMRSKSRLTSKYQTTIPQKIRTLLLLKKGDEVVFEIENGQVTVRKATPSDLDYFSSVESTLTEWSGENDEKAYEDL